MRDIDIGSIDTSRGFHSLKEFIDLEKSRVFESLFGVPISCAQSLANMEGPCQEYWQGIFEYIQQEQDVYDSPNFS